MKRTLFTLILSLLSVALFAEQNNHLICVTVLPQKQVVEKVAGPAFSVEVMVPDGNNPATADWTASQMKALERCAFYFAVGYLPVETQTILPWLKEHPRVKLTDHSLRLSLLEGHHHEGHHEEFDPHIWTSPKNLVSMGEDVCRVLSEAFPEEAEAFSARFYAFKSELDALMVKTEARLSRYAESAFLVYHPALSYYAHDFDLHQISIEQDGKEPSPRQLKRIISRCKKEGIKLILVQRQFDTENAKLVASEIGGKIETVDPLAYDILSELNRLCDLFADNL